MLTLSTMQHLHVVFIYMLYCKVFYGECINFKRAVNPTFEHMFSLYNSTNIINICTYKNNSILFGVRMVTCIYPFKEWHTNTGAKNLLAIHSDLIKRVYYFFVKHSILHYLTICIVSKLIHKTTGYDRLNTRFTKQNKYNMDWIYLCIIHSIYIYMYIYID